MSAKEDLAVASEVIPVSLAERSYRIHLCNPSTLSKSRESADSGFETKILEVLSELDRCSHAVIVADGAVAPLYAIPVREKLQLAGIRSSLLVIPSGEQSKSMGELTRIWEFLLREKTDRASVMIAIGGGVIGDLAGFAAASYTRGIRFIQVPTTLLAMVDSSVGGKTGINLPSAKNMIGAFWQPTSVVINTRMLDSLPDREFRSGLAEVVKYGVILDEEFFEYLESHAVAIGGRHPESLQHIIARSCQLKAEVVSKDEHETTGLRAILNYGHTFAHAIEADTKYGQLLHGEAVSIGMHLAAETALRRGMIDASSVERQSLLLQRLGLPIRFEGLKPMRLWELMQNDKKVENGKLAFILPTKIGHVERTHNVTFQEAFGE
jgi:3-dehydroquinate synthase